MEEANKIPEESETEADGSVAAEDAKTTLAKAEEEQAGPTPSEAEAATTNQPAATGQPHVQFAGERHDDELDRVKEALSKTASSPAKEDVSNEGKSVDTAESNTTDAIKSTSSTTSDPAADTQAQPAAEPSKAIESVED